MPQEWESAPLVEDEVPEWDTAPLLDTSPPKPHWGRAKGEFRPEGGHGPLGRPYRTTAQKAKSALKKANREAGEFLLTDLPNAARRSVMKGVGEATLYPYDLIYSGRNFIAGGGFSGYESPWDALNPWSEWRPTTTAPMLELPSATYERDILNKYTTPPPEGPGRIAEWVNSALISGKMTPKIRSSTPTAPNPRLPSGAPQEIIEEGVKHDVPVFYDDVVDAPFSRRASKLAEYLGRFGTGQGRQVQHDLAKEAARRAAASRAPEGVKDFDSIAETLQGSLRRKYRALKKYKTQLYTRAATALDPHGFVPTPTLNKVYFDLEKEMGRLGMAKDRAAASALDQIYYAGPAGNFTQMSKLSDELGARISRYYKGENTTLGSDGVQYMQKMKEALDRDIGAFAQRTSPEGHAFYQRADDFYKKHIVPYRQPGFRDLVKTGEPEKAWQYLIAQGTLPSRAKRLYNSLDDKGRATVRYGLVMDAYQKALSDKGVFSPARFSSYLANHEPAVRQFFSGAEQKEILGFKKLMRAVERAGQYAEDPPTGQRYILPALFGSGAAYGVEYPAMAITAGLSLRALFQTQRGRDLMVKFSESTGGRSNEETLNDIARYLTNAVARAQQSGHPDKYDVNAAIEEAVTFGEYDGRE
jgi:hypothetical protein